MATSDARARPGAGTGADHFRHSYTKDKTALVRRLARIEGQVRGIARMIEREEYCVDILQQTSALRAAVDSLSILLLEDHVQGCVRTAAARAGDRCRALGWNLRGKKAEGVATDLRQRRPLPRGNSREISGGEGLKQPLGV